MHQTFRPEPVGQHQAWIWWRNIGGGVDACRPWFGKWWFTRFGRSVIVINHARPCFYFTLLINRRVFFKQRQVEFESNKHVAVEFECKWHGVMDHVEACAHHTNFDFALQTHFNNGTQRHSHLRHRQGTLRKANTQVRYCLGKHTSIMDHPRVGIGRWHGVRL